MGIVPLAVGDSAFCSHNLDLRPWLPGKAITVNGLLSHARHSPSLGVRNAGYV
jgi:hypothetical protein